MDPEGRVTEKWKETMKAARREQFPRYVKALLRRGDAYAATKEYDKAIADYTKAIHVDPKNGHTYQPLAWLLATCPKDGVRDGKKALELGKKSCELSTWKEADKLSTLAAAYAETRSFKEAVEWQRKAIELGYDDKEQKEKANMRMKLYEEGKPYRQE
jgi:tetratricopeptide (TPR) repeat protein